MLKKVSKLKSSFATKYCDDLQSCLCLCKQILTRDKKSITDTQVTDMRMITAWNVNGSSFCNNKELIKGKINPLINHSLLKLHEELRTEFYISSQRRFQIPRELNFPLYFHCKIFLWPSVPSIRDGLRGRDSHYSQSKEKMVALPIGSQISKRTNIEADTNVQSCSTETSLPLNSKFIDIPIAISSFIGLLVASHFLFHNSIIL
jgi:hypothetical protein